MEKESTWEKTRYIIGGIIGLLIWVFFLIPGIWQLAREFFYSSGPFYQSISKEWWLLYGLIVLVWLSIEHVIKNLPLVYVKTYAPYLDGIEARFERIIERLSEIHNDLEALNNRTIT